MKERTWINRVTSEIEVQPLHPDTGGPVHAERVIAVREEPKMHLGLYQRDATDGMRALWQFAPGFNQRDATDGMRAL